MSPKVFQRLSGTDYEDGLNAFIDPVYAKCCIDIHFLVCHLSFPSGVKAGTNEL